MQRHERLGGAAGHERIDVGEDGRRRERHRQPPQRAGIEPPFPGEVADQDRKYEKAHIAGVKTGVLIQLHPEQRRHLDGERRRRRETERNQGVRSPRSLRLPGVGARDDELLPEAVRVLARELPR